MSAQCRCRRSFRHLSTQRGARGRLKGRLRSSNLRRLHSETMQQPNSYGKTCFGALVALTLCRISKLHVYPSANGGICQRTGISCVSCSCFSDAGLNDSDC